jgi:predicted DNA-binding protein with PD1-like motif
MKSFRGGSAAELIAFRLDEGEDLVDALARAAEELNLGSAAVAMASGTLGIARLIAAGTPGPAPLGVILEQTGPLSIASMQGWILAGQPELQLVLSRGAELIAGRAVSGCRVQGSVEGLLLRLGNLRLERVSEPATGHWSLGSGASPSAMPRFELQGQAIDPRALLIVPRQILERHRVLPVALSGTTLIVATADPRNLFARDDVRLASGMQIQWLETPKAALEAALHQVFRWLDETRQ